MAQYENISINTVIDDYISFSGHEGELDENWVLNQANDAISRIITDRQLCHNIAILDVRDYKAELPPYFRYIIQAAYRKKPVKTCTREVVSQCIQKAVGTGCDLEINLKCPKCHSIKSCSCEKSRIIAEVDVNAIYRNANPQHYAAYMKHYYKFGNLTKRGHCSVYDDSFYLMRKTSNSFFNIPYHINECINLNLDCRVEYDIKLPNIIVNFKEGEILLSYLGYLVDSDGYRMVPNSEIVFKAINYFIEERMAFKTYRNSKAGPDRIFWQQMLELSEKMIKRARVELQMPDEDEWWQFIKNHWMKVLPYRKWEQNLNRYQSDQFRYPDQTYNIRGYNG